MCLLIPTALHFAASESVIMSGYVYYHLAAIADGITILALSRLLIITKTSKALLAVSCLFFAVNVLGFVMFMLSYSPYLYDIASIALYAATVVILLRKDSRHERYMDLDIWRASVRLHDSANSNSIQASTKK